MTGHTGACLNNLNHTLKDTKSAYVTNSKTYFLLFHGFSGVPIKLIFSQLSGMRFFVLTS